jgi:hypothetical protein
MKAKHSLSIITVGVGLTFGFSAAASAAAIIGPATFTYYSGSEPNPIPDPYTSYNYGNYTECATQIVAPCTSEGITFTGTPAQISTNVNGISKLRDIGGADTDPNWISGSDAFAADITATITATSAGNYSFGFGSDDAGYVFINGNLISSVTESGPNGYPGLVPFTVALNAGANTLEIQYDNIYGGGAVVNFQAVPEPATWAMFLIGFSGVGFMMRNLRRKSAVVTA